MIKDKKKRKNLLLVAAIFLVAAGLCAALVMVILQSSPNQLSDPLTDFTTEPTQEITDPPENPEPTEPPIPSNLYTKDDFVMDGDYLSCTAAEAILGIDVSKYQGNINWNQVKAAGMEFVMIRVGGRGYGAAGGMYADTKADTYYRGAKAAGLKIGAYFFSQAITVEEAIEEALYALELTKNWVLDLPIVFDWEYVSETARTANISTRMRTDCAKAFCDTLRTAGQEGMIYISPWFGVPYLDELTDYPQWLALYTGEMTYKYRFDMWQYTCTGRVPGVSGDVDINLLFPFDDTFQ